MSELSLFREINPNIEEIIERKQSIDGDEVIIDHEPELGHMCNDIFTSKCHFEKERAKHILLSLQWRATTAEVTTRMHALVGGRLDY